MKPTLKQYYVIAVALLAAGLAVRAWTSGSREHLSDAMDELPVIALRHADQSFEPSGNSISTAAAISTRFSTENTIQPVTAQAESIVWDSETIYEQPLRQTANPLAHSQHNHWPRIIDSKEISNDTRAKQSQSETHFPRIVQSGFAPPISTPKQLSKSPDGDQRVLIANQYANSGDARKSAGNSTELESFSVSPPPRQDSKNQRSINSIVVKNPMNQVVENESSDAFRQQPDLNSPGIEPAHDSSFLQVAEDSSIESAADTADKFASADDFFGSPAFDDSDEFESVATVVPPSARQVDHDKQPHYAAEITAQTEVQPDALAQGNHFASPADIKSVPSAASGLTNIEINHQQPIVAESNDFQPDNPTNRVASFVPVPVNRPNSPNKKSTPKKKQLTPGALVGAESFVLAAQPPANAHWKDSRPQVDPRAVLIETVTEDFAPDAIDECLPYAPYHQMEVYEGKTLYANQRPLVELGRPWYQLGQLSPGSNILGKHNNLVPQFLVFGDFRTAFASNSQNDDSATQMAFELNLDFDLRLTSTGRFHMFMSPLDNGVVNTGYLFDEDQWVDQYDANIDFGYFEGDLGAMVGGFINRTLPFDLPYTLGVIPLLFQNGIWMEDAILGVAATIPARSSARLDISNMDITFFAGFDKINSPAFAADDSAARMYGVASFIEALNGYFEIDYAYLEDRTLDNRSYHNIGMAYSRRYGRFVSNSTRVIINAGQSTDVVENSADGTLLLSENTLITGSPLNVLPYFNFFAGFDRPQSAARAAQAGGILRNTGILFESDGMTNYPTLDATGNDTVGGALGLNLLANDFRQQLVVEMAFLDVIGNNATRIAAGKQYGIGARYQLPLNNSVIFRTDAMYGFLEDDSDVHGVRMELRKKF